MIPNNYDFLRLSNLSMIARLIWQRPEISRIEIAKTLGLNKSSVTRLSSYLFEKNLILETGKGVASREGGPKPKKLVINGNFACVMGIELQPEGYRAVVSSINGTPLSSCEGKFPAYDDIDQFEDSVIHAVDEILSQCRDISIPILGISFAMPGIINPSKGQVLWSHPFALKDYAFVDRISSILKIPVFLENDSNAHAWGHLKQERKKQNFFYLLGKFHKRKTQGTIKYIVGIGVGVVVNNEIYHGNDYSAGEFLSAFKPLLNKNKHIGADNILGLPDSVLREAEHNPEMMNAIFTEIMLNFGLLIAMFNPESIYISGDFLKYREILEEVMKDSFQAWKSLGLALPSVELVDADHFGGARGAVRMILSQVFKIPSVYDSENKKSFDWYKIFNFLEEARSPSSWRLNQEDK